VTGPDASRKLEHGIEPLLSIDEVSGLLRISESGVYRLVRHGELPRVKVGNRTLFEASEIRNFIARRRAEQTQPIGGRTLAALDLGASDG
jgi:excisionase family DNA binding protein